MIRRRHRGGDEPANQQIRSLRCLQLKGIVSREEVLTHAQKAIKYCAGIPSSVTAS